MKQSDVPSALPSSESLKIRCAIADYILNSREGSLEERLLEFVAAVPLDVSQPSRSGLKSVACILEKRQ